MYSLSRDFLKYAIFTDLGPIQIHV